MTNIKRTFPVVMPNLKPSVLTRQTHILAIPPACCPIAKQPLEGSTITISYDARNGHLEVMQLEEFIKSFVGGKRNPETGEWVVREMEQMIQVITQQCADWLNIKVRVTADIVTSYGKVILRCVASGKEP